MATLRSSASWKRSRERRRARAAPAPELHPPGFSGGKPQLQGYRIEPRSDVERRFLHEVTKAQVLGEARGMPDVMRSDWDRVKLAEARWVKGIIEKRPVKIASIDRLRSAKPEFQAAVRYVGRADKRLEADAIRARAELERASADPDTPPPPSSGDSLQRDGEDRQESAFMAGLRARAKELAQRDDAQPSWGIERDRKRER